MPLYNTPLMRPSFISLATREFGNLPEQIRRWSEQIEYDEDNVGFLFDAYEKKQLRYIVRSCSFLWYISNKAPPLYRGMPC